MRMKTRQARCRFNQAVANSNRCEFPTLFYPDSIRIQFAKKKKKSSKVIARNFSARETTRQDESFGIRSFDMPVGRGK